MLVSWPTPPLLVGSSSLALPPHLLSRLVESANHDQPGFFPLPAFSLVSTIKSSPYFRSSRALLFHLASPPGMTHMFKAELIFHIHCFLRLQFLQAVPSVGYRYIHQPWLKEFAEARKTQDMISAHMALPTAQHPVTRAQIVPSWNSLSISSLHLGCIQNPTRMSLNQ